ncbi:septation ring formation regulator EzrA [Spiroplasma endosymbiont of Aspidapion aeneum]|uniref:septation ring formation regulator EzrA n=1 Tax=Spiroplasma endosymbiont of Aspidapion aeneum TaxID=3066276 RepID=UPI00313BFFBB
MGILKIVEIFILLFIATFAFFIAVWFMNKQNNYRLIIRNIALSFDLIENIQKLPIKTKIIRLKNLLITSEGEFDAQNEYWAWRFKYELIHNNEKFLIGIILQINKLLSSKETLNSNKIAVRKSEIIYKKVVEIMDDCKKIDNEIRDIFLTETIQKNEIISLKDLYSIVKHHFGLLRLDKIYNHENILRLEGGISSLFKEFNILINEGKYISSCDILSKIEVSLSFFFKKLDTAPAAATKLLIEYPRRLKELNEKMFDQPSQDFVDGISEIKELISRAVNALSTLKNSVIFKCINKIEKKLRALSIYARIEENLKENLERELPEIEYVIMNIMQIAAELNKIILSLKDVKLKTPIEITIFEKTYSDLEKLKRKFQSIKPSYSSINEEISDYQTKNSKAIEVIEELLKIFYSLKDTSRFISTKIINIGQLEEKIRSIDSWATKCSVKINQNKKIIILHNKLEKVFEIKNQIKIFTRDYFDKLSTNEELNKISRQISNLEHDVMICDHEIDHLIFMSKLSQKLLGYCTRYAGIIGQKELLEIQSSIEGGDIFKAVNNAISILISIKNSRKVM